ncbi:hypothetical protein C7974DRAFT_161761 [Boeremia exigua]|uniref:uncharacterized protein n=1 Tax=Boeremia exigua TaxID=749465 RepID=UPI001E8CAEFB|nr:uncharacterized protein C7974DRAFT_161761 [Boeremia exigua]KAH6638506.1 hypothetical protein C7974DRAFT_161761 [Boeremia exigua]
MEEVLASSHHGLDNNSTFSTPWSYVKPDAPWGFVVYRAVYGKESEEPWKQILGLLRDTVTVPKTTQQPFPWLGPIQSDPQFELTVMEDEQRFAGADSHTIREAFREWVAGDLPSRVLNPAIEGGIDNIRAMIRSTAIGEAHEYGHGKPIHPWHIAPPRWSFCVLVDEICLRSLNRADGLCPVVKMVNLRFPEGRCESIAEGWEDGETEDPQEDVGWMYTYAHSYEVWYQVLSDPSNWDDEVWYMRPEKEEFPSANDVE